MFNLHLLIRLISSKKCWKVVKDLVLVLNWIIEVKLFFCKILAKIQTKRERLNFLKIQKTRFRDQKCLPIQNTKTDIHSMLLRDSIHYLRAQYLVLIIHSLTMPRFIQGSTLPPAFISLSESQLINGSNSVLTNPLVKG